MEGIKVLIPTSGLGSRLGNITKYTNKSLVRVGDVASISYIINSYPSNTEFVITLGHYGSHVKQYLNIAHPETSIDYVDVDNYMGEGSSLLYSISLCEDYLQCPFILHVCDTIIPNLKNKKINFTSNWIIGGKGNSSQSYRTINVLNNNVVSINEKGESNFDYVYVGVSGIVDYLDFWNTVKDVLKTNNSSDLSDCHVIRKMLDEKHFSSVYCDMWYDIGNIDSLKYTREYFKPTINVLDKEDENIFIISDTVIKFFHNKKICSDRISRSNNLLGLIPTIKNKSENFYSYDYVQGQLLSDVVDIDKFKNLLIWASNNLWTKKKSLNYRNNAISFYKEKTLLRIDKFLQKYNLKDKKDIINGIEVPPLKEIISQINFESIVGNNPTGFHGDFILDNIIYNLDNSFTLIDWRQDFSGDLECGDMNYDLAKLNHNLILNHKVLSNGMYDINIGDKIFCDVYVKKTLIDCQKILMEFCFDSGIKYNTIKILSSLIWINMAPLHEHSLDMFLYYFGKYNLYLNVI